MNPSTMVRASRDQSSMAARVRASRLSVVGIDYHSSIANRPGPPMCLRPSADPMISFPVGLHFSQKFVDQIRDRHLLGTRIEIGQDPVA
jgi:hypothetical protein